MIYLKVGLSYKENFSSPLGVEVSSMQTSWKMRLSHKYWGVLRSPAG